MTLALLTDFGLTGPYIGQVKAVLQQQSKGIAIIDLFSDLPAFSPKSAAYLLPAYCSSPFQTGTVFLCVVDPGVGTQRSPVVLWADGKWFVGPDNGLFSQLVRRADQAKAWTITASPDNPSATFHGRDIFAPVAASLTGLSAEAHAQGDITGCTMPPSFSARASGQPLLTPQNAETLDRPEWPNDLAEIIYIDHYGNAMTGLRPTAIMDGQAMSIAGQKLMLGKTFADAAPGQPLCYENSNGLLEIAVNQGNASLRLGIGVGEPVEVDCKEAGKNAF